MRLFHALRAFGRDLGDRGARRAQRQLQIPDLWGIPLALLGTVFPFVTQLKSALADIIGLPSVIFPLLMSIIAAYWCVIIVTSKDVPARAVGIAAGQETALYRHTNGLRNAAKLGLLALAVLMLGATREAAIELSPLPSTIYGFVINATSGEPYAEIVVAAEDHRGAMLSEATHTDSIGFYILHLSRRTNRSARIRLQPPRCAAPQYLSLSSWHETKKDSQGAALSSNLHPVFIHAVSCGAE